MLNLERIHVQAHIFVGSVQFLVGCQMKASFPSLLSAIGHSYFLIVLVMVFYRKRTIHIYIWGEKQTDFQELAHEIMKVTSLKSAVWPAGWRPRGRANVAA